MTTYIAVSEREEATPAARTGVGDTRVARRWIAFDAQWCRTCRVCETMCAIVHEGAARPALARIHVTFDEFPPSVATSAEPAAADYVSATVCVQCADAPCIEVCPTHALSRDTQTGAVAIDTAPGSETACSGCMRCRKACPWDIPQRHPERKVALKCDLCAGREGGPVCVEMCPLSGKALRVACYTEGHGESPRVSQREGRGA